MRLSKIYTKMGDGGETMLADGGMVSKLHPRVEAYGAVDELNAHVGFLRDNLLESDHGGSFESHLRRVQNELFDLGGELATPASVLDESRQQVVREDSVSRLEEEMDAWNESLQPLKNFVLPGGHRVNSCAHVCRTVCRRAERELLRIPKSEELRSITLVYLNRLSDWFFVLSRKLSQGLGADEILWQQKKMEKPKEL